MQIYFYEKALVVYENLSIDEKAIGSGHNYASILSEPHTGSVIEVVESRTEEAAKGLIEKGLSKEQREQVKTISMDMWDGFSAAAKKKLPDAEIIYDNFHIIKYLNKAIDKVRRREVKEEEGLKNSRYVLLKNKENLTDQQKQKFEQLCQNDYEVLEVWQMREEFREMFIEASQDEGVELFEKWSEAARRSGIREIKEVVKTFAAHLQGVISGMVSGLSNAMAERVNGKIQLLKTVGRGYRRFTNFRKAILFFYGNLNLFPLNSQ